MRTNVVQELFSVTGMFTSTMQANAHNVLFNRLLMVAVLISVIACAVFNFAVALFERDGGSKTP